MLRRRSPRYRLVGIGVLLNLDVKMITGTQSDGPRSCFDRMELERVIINTALEHAIDPHLFRDCSATSIVA